MEYRKSTLENGLRVATLATPAARSVTLGLVVEAGSSIERPDQRGLAHLVEHMLFQGSSNRDALEIARWMDGAGGRIGGFTSRDYTCYFAQVLRDYVPYAIDLLGDVLLNPVFAESALEREKRAIRCEAEAHRDNPEHRVHELMRGQLWPDHPLGRPILGDASSLDALGREELIYFLHTHYLPNRMIVTAAGAVDHDDFVAQIRDAFWRLLGERAATPHQPTRAQGGLAMEPVPVSQAYFSLGFEAPRFAAEDRYAAHLIDQVLGAGISSRLFSALRERHGLVYDVGSRYEAWRDAGLFSIEGSTQGDSLEVALEVLLDEVDALLRGRRPLHEEELHRSKVQLRSQILLAAEDTHALMSRMATQELYFGRCLDEAELLTAIDALDLDTVRAWCVDTLAPAFDGASLALVGPESDCGPQLQETLGKLCPSLAATKSSETSATRPVRRTA